MQRLLEWRANVQPFYVPWVCFSCCIVIFISAQRQILVYLDSCDLLDRFQFIYSLGCLKDLKKASIYCHFGIMRLNLLCWRIHYVMISLLFGTSGLFCLGIHTVVFMICIPIFLVIYSPSSQIYLFFQNNPIKMC